jgi:CRP-like cAMP-binding protein
MFCGSSRPVGNRLLDALSSNVYERLAKDLNLVSFSFGAIIYESGAHMEHVFFPTTSHVSLLYTMVNGATAEMGLVGNEGVVGISLVMGGDTTPNRAVVQSAGEALQLSANAMRTEFSRGSEFQQLVLRYTHTLITQISQTAVCNRLHSVKQRLCRWLLMTQDRTNSDEMQMTHQFISKMLGVRREGVTHVAHDLQQEGLISYARGQIRITDRTGLESCTCECYAVVREEHNRLLKMGEEQDRLLDVGDRRKTSRRLGTDRRASQTDPESDNFSFT